MAGWLALLFPALAAASPATLVVLPDAEAGAPPAEVAAALTEPSYLSRAGFYQALHAARAKAAIAAGKAEQQKGQRALAELRRDEAQASLQRALEHFAAGQQDADACREAAGAARDLSFLFWQQRKLAAARRWRSASAGLATTALDPTRYQPAFVAFWQQDSDNPSPVPTTVSVRGAARKGKERKVTVWSACRELGPAPAAISVSGAALVLLVRDASFRAKVIAPTRSQLVELTAPARRAQPASAAQARALLAERGGAELLWLRRGEEGWIVDRFSAPGGWTMDARRIARAPGATPPQPPPPPQKTEPRRGELAGWLLTGGAIAVLAAGVVSAVVARKAGDEIERKASAGELFDPADESRNEVARYTSYTSFVVGGLLATAAAVYWIWRSRAPDQPSSSVQPRGSGLAYTW